jgi:hypothetical protein
VSYIEKGVRDMLKRPLENEEDLAKCPVCDFYFKSDEGFTCIKCRRGLLCKKHKVAGTKECASCVIERRNKELSDLKAQEMSLKSFLRLLQFLFLVFAVLFIAVQIGLDDTLELLQYDFIKDGLPYFGGGAFLGYVVFYFILNNQKAKNLELENVIRKMRLAVK